jgi:hypothetical protein
MLVGAVGSLPMVLSFAVHGGAVPSDAFSTFVSADYTPDADEMPVTLTFTAKDAGDNALEGVSVTYA